MKEAFDKIKERLEAKRNEHSEICVDYAEGLHDGYEGALNIVSEVEAEYGNGWIPCSERLPEEATVYEVTEEIIICSQKQYIIEHRLFGTEGEWLCPSNRKVIAWMPLPEPYKPEKGAQDGTST